MSKIRFQALSESSKRVPVTVNEGTRRSALFGENVFNQNTMRQFLTKDAYKGVMSLIRYKHNQVMLLP